MKLPTAVTFDQFMIMMIIPTANDAISDGVPNRRNRAICDGDRNNI